MENLINCKDLATKLKVTESAVRKWIDLGKIPFYKINGAVRFSPEEIESWMKLQNKKE